MQEIIQLIVDNGISVICVAYMIYFQSTTLKSLVESLNSMNNRLTQIETKLDIK